MRPEKAWAKLCRAMFVFFKLALLMSIISGSVYIPAMYYMTTYTESTGLLSDDAITSCLGFLMSIVNGLLYTPIRYSSLNMHFQWKVRADVFNLTCTLVIVIVATIVSFGTTLHPVIATETHMAPHLAMQGSDVLRNANIRMFVGRKL